MGFGSKHETCVANQNVRDPSPNTHLNSFPFRRSTSKYFVIYIYLSTWVWHSLTVWLKLGYSQTHLFVILFNNNIQLLYFPLCFLGPRGAPWGTKKALRGHPELWSDATGPRGSRCAHLPRGFQRLQRCCEVAPGSRGAAPAAQNGEMRCAHLSCDSVGDWSDMKWFFADTKRCLVT